jgi:hypothetical protein
MEKDGRQGFGGASIGCAFAVLEIFGKSADYGKYVS